MLWFLILGCAPDEPAPGPVEPEKTHWVLSDGETVSGEAVATYDQSQWWDAADETWTAVYDGFDLYWIASSEVEEVVEAERSWRAYRQDLRDLGVTVDHSPLEGVAWVIMGNSGYHLEENGFGDFAWDLVRLDENDARYLNQGAYNSDFLVWDQPVYAPVGGEIVEIVRGAPDNAPGAYPEGAENNLVGIRMTDQLALYLLHFRQNTIPPELEVGDVVQAGDFLGRVGNSGVSLEPHVHVTVLGWDGDRYWSVPTEWRDVHLGLPGESELRDFVVPTTGDYVGTESF